MKLLTIPQTTEGDSVAVDYRNRADIPELLRAHGWQHDQGRNWTRPGKSGGCSAILNNDGGFFVFSSNAGPLEADRAYSPFDLFTALEAGGDRREATKKLAALGFGAKTSPDPTPTATPGKIIINGLEFDDEPPPEFRDDAPAPFAWPGEPAKAPEKIVALPAPQLLSAFTDEDQTPPAVLIAGLLFQGGKLLFSGPSKSNKTWIMLHLALCIATGTPWLGFATTRKPVLIVDCELMQFDLLKRLHVIARAMGVTDLSNVFIVSLRGQRLTLERLKAMILPFAEKMDLGAICIDPVYRISEGRDENSNGEIADLLCGVEEIAHATGAAVLLTHHFAKGNAGAKASLDRMSGAGVWARDPDCLISLTEAEGSDEENRVFVIEPTVRSFPPTGKKAIRWIYPLWRIDEEASTEVKGGPGRPKGYGDGSMVLAIFDGAEELRTKDLQTLADQKGITRKRFFEIMGELKAKGQISDRKEGRSVFYRRTCFNGSENISKPFSPDEQRD
jgi:hypothetical protein